MNQEVTELFAGANARWRFDGQSASVVDVKTGAAPLQRVRSVRSRSLFQAASWHSPWGRGLRKADFVILERTPVYADLQRLCS